MQNITNDMILNLAPNPAAAANGSKISRKGGFIRLEKAEDDTFFLGECTGSGKSNYITSADFIDSSMPVFRCSCPSRQFPCKHSLGLLYEMMEGKKFEIFEIPEDILKKRVKKQDRIQKTEDTKTAAPKKNLAARAKKLKKQMEGLELAGKLVNEILNIGLGAMGGTSLKTYRQISKQLGDYYLPGPQKLLNNLILEIEEYQKDGKEVHYDNAVETLKRLHTLVKKSHLYLTDKLEKKEVNQDDNLLFEELGGIWKLTDLMELGLFKENVRLVQLCFYVDYDKAAKEYIDTAYWVDVETGEVNYTQNYRPVKALKYIKQEDSMLAAAQVPSVCFYPGEGNKRIRWEGMEINELKPSDFQNIMDKASLLAPAVKEAKNLLKNTLSNRMYVKLIRFSEIALCGKDLVLMDSEQKSIILDDKDGMDLSKFRLCILPDTSLLQNQVLAGAFYYDRDTKSIRIQPLSIITSGQIVRLLY